MAIYIRKRVVVEAMQLKPETWEEMYKFLGAKFFENGGFPGFYQTDDSPILKIGLEMPRPKNAQEYDWIIRDVTGEIYSCKPDLFRATYSLVTEKD
jgi:hypothetical protein